MSEQIKLIIVETESLPLGYKFLEELSAAGLEALEFYPHANGVRLLFRSAENFEAKLPAQAVQISVSLKIFKALLSQTSNTLKKHLAVVETKKLSELLSIAVEFEKVDSDILEIRALRSNNQKNYALFTVDDKAVAEKILKNTEHSILNSSSPALKEFLGFK